MKNYDGPVDYANDQIKAQKLACGAVAGTQADNKLPLWFQKNVTVFGRHEKDHIWRVLFYMFLNPKLAENESWEVVRGIKERVQTDPVAGEKSIVFLFGCFEEDRVDLFEASVDISNETVSFSRSTDLSKLDPETLYLAIE